MERDLSRRLGADVPGLEELLGAGVFYGAAVTEATALKGQRAFVVGGANSAGQAAVHLAASAIQQVYRYLALS
jgi:thioredoxin reductase (NADPH)